ncbi:PAS domain-containing protein [Pyxidicoccus fallax]|uniref:histidine kinase n=1 Tax=Pyxidicoccus fallax TaxID=394095 RepID=A0A848LGM3_9BACT|nr:PAS domain-containing protein [Pyxidicoccus fallax]NMO16505.1 PAS domain-containing protein [Pyxidicoccus fallax]NPC77433.1 PAS domain-containing protein [Pyxidicoccus fallax]
MAGATNELSAWLDAAVDPFVACDAEERVCILNSAAERLLGWKREELRGQPVSRLFPQRLQHYAGKSLLRYLLSRRESLGGRAIRVLARRRDGVEVLVELTVGASGQGADERIVINFRRLHEVIDTVHEPVEQSLHPAEARPPAESGTNGDSLYRVVVEHAPLGIFHFDTTPVITACNERFMRIIGTPKRILVGLNLLTIRDEHIMYCVRETLAGHNAHYEGEYRSVTSGKLTPVYIRFAPIRDGAGRVEGGVGIVEDITERRRTERERDESLAQLTTLFRTAPIGLGFLDNELRYVRVNDVLAAINGSSPEAHAGRRPREVLGPTGMAVEKALRRVLQSGEPLEKREATSQELGMPGPPRYLAGSFYPVRAPDGRILGIGVMIQDITDRKLADEERGRLYREAQDAIRVRDDFLSIASHELKTPLTPLSLRLATLERKLERGEHVDPATLRHARQHLLRITGLINDLLDASRIEAGRLALHPETTRLDSLVEHVLQAMEVHRGDHSIHFERPQQPVLVRADPYRLEQVIANLVENAFKYSPDGGTIRVELRQRGELAMLSVADPGIGIPPDQQKLLFDRYFRARNVSSRSYGGLGLGLYISRDIVERHGGRIWVESEVGRGSTFHVALPLLQGAATQPPVEQPDHHVH